MAIKSERKEKKNSLLISAVKCRPIMSNVIRLLDVMTTNVMKEKIQYLDLAFISDHLQKDNKN